MALVVLGVVVVLSLSGCQPQPPKIEIPTRRHDFGTVVQGERVEHAFEVRNRGGSDLLLEEVKVGGVLKVEGFDRVIPPGGSGRVRVSVNTGGVHGVGNLVVRVISNDPEAPETALGLDGRVVKPLEIEPGDRIYFFQPGEQRRNLVRYGSRPILVT
ncbi:MAG TPA: DUF1573 domain-containing protein, partial [Thermoanaerobaculia bacterium]|nr:DUF1573 domain-containing protein [Thermoanaerobaculia bacterium]